MRDKIIYILGAVALILLARDIYLFTGFPPERNQGVIFKIIFFHVPMAITALTCAMVAFIASALFLITKQFKYDALAVELIALPLFGIFYNVRWTSQFWQLMMVIGLATWGMTVTGTIFSALTVNIRLREVMLPILNFPILIPALLGAMQLTSSLVAGNPITAANDSWLKMLIGFDVMYTAVSVFLVETVLVGG